MSDARGVPTAINNPGFCESGVGTSHGTIGTLYIRSLYDGRFEDFSIHPPIPHSLKMAFPKHKKSFDDTESKIVTENVEDVHAEQSLAAFPLLQGKTPAELKALNKAVLKKLDYYFLPCVTMMLLMRSAHTPFSQTSRNTNNVDISSATWTELMYLMPALLACRATYTCRTPSGPQASPCSMSVTSSPKSQPACSSQKANQASYFQVSCLHGPL